MDDVRMGSELIFVIIIGDGMGDGRAIIRNIISKCRNKIILIEARKPLLCLGKSSLNARVSTINAVSQ